MILSVGRDTLQAQGSTHQIRDRVYIHRTLIVNSKAQYSNPAGEMTFLETYIATSQSNTNAVQRTSLGCHTYSENIWTLSLLHVYCNTGHILLIAACHERNSTDTTQSEIQAVHPKPVFSYN